MATAPDMQHAPTGKSKKSKKNRSQSAPPDPLMPNNAAAGGAVGGAPVPAPPTRQLEFNQAMKDFKTMFPSMDRDVIETVLRANNGAVDATIDQLLTLTADMPDTPQRPQHPELPAYGDPVNTGFSSPPPGVTPPAPVTRGSAIGMSIGDQPPPYSPPSPNSPFSQEMRSRQLPPTPNQRGPLPTPPQSVPSPMPVAPQVPAPLSPPQEPGEPTRLAPPAPRPRHPRWNPPLLGDLPPDFLRVTPVSTTPRSSGTQAPRRLSGTQQAMVSMKLQERMERNVQQQSSLDVNDVEMQRMLEDERFALTLQNEEFMRELQRNPEFIAALDRDYTQAIAAASATATTTPGGAQAPTASRNPQLNSSPPSYSAAASPPSQGEAGATGGISSDDVEFRNKLSHMGKTTRYKFAQMAKRFNYRKRRSSSKPQIDGAPAASMTNLLDDYDESGDSALLGTRPEVEENVYSEPQKSKGQKKKGSELEEPIIFYQEDNEFALHPET